MKKLILISLMSLFGLALRGQTPYPVDGEIYLSPRPAQLPAPKGTPGSSYEPYYEQLLLAPMQGKIIGSWLDYTNSGWQNVFMGQVVDPDSVAASKGAHISLSSGAAQRLIVMNNTHVVTGNFSSFYFGGVTLWSVADTTIQFRTITTENDPYTGSFNMFRLSDTRFVIFQERGLSGGVFLYYQIGTITPSTTVELSEAKLAGDLEPGLRVVDNIVSFPGYFLVQLADGVHSFTFDEAENEFNISAPITGLPFQFQNRRSVPLTSGAFASLEVNGAVTMDIVGLDGLSADPVASVTFDLSSDINTDSKPIGLNLAAHTILWLWRSADGETHVLLVGLNENDDDVIRASHKVVEASYFESFVRLNDHLAAFNYGYTPGLGKTIQYIQLLSDEDIFNELSLTGTSFDFGEVTINSTETRQFSMTNNGQSAVTITDVDVPDGFSVDWDGGVIPPSGTQNITVSFQPDQVQDYSGTIYIVRGDVFQPVAVSVTGTGVAIAGTGNEVDGQITTYPNPTSSSVTILSASPVHEYKLYSIEGQLLNYGNDTTITFNNHKGGIYFLQISAGNRVVTKKIILKP